jgi:D-sedoheptulose 7-phosphate isomerase
VTGTAAASLLAERLERLTDQRAAANERFFAVEAERIARLCHRMAERFARGGRLLAVGATPQDRSDARHVAVEFVHPVIVGKRALPALAVVPDGGALAGQVRLLASPVDMAIAFADEDGAAGEALARLRALGCLTIRVGRGSADWAFDPPAEDPFIRQELGETLYHVLWELVHVFFEHRGLLQGREAGPVHDVGASSFLYPSSPSARTTSTPSSPTSAARSS